MSVLIDEVETTSWDVVSDMRLLHKKNIEEVFLTRFKKIKDDLFSFKAIINGRHHYYSDHTVRHTDLIFLLECGRQAETYIVHKHNNQPLDTHFILDNWTCQFTDGYNPEISLENKVIDIQVLTHNQHLAKDRLLKQDYLITFFLKERKIAQLELSVKYMKSESYLSIRKRARGCPLVYSDKCTFSHKDRVSPSTFPLGRGNVKNIALSKLIRVGNGAEADLLVDFENKSYFDHRQDHYPAMVLVEAGKQISHAIASREMSRNKYVLSSLNCQFNFYAEFEGVVKLTAMTLKKDDDKNNISVMVCFIQNKKTIATGEYKLMNLIEKITYDKHDQQHSY